MREPAATVIEPAFTSPTMTPPSSTSTRLADSILPCSSPPTTTIPASTWPVRCAPESMLKLPSMRTSPLKRPAIRTFPEPSIFPSIESPEAITDSPPSTAVFGVGRRGETANPESPRLRSGALLRSRAAALGGTDEPAGAGVGVSFHRAISNSPAVVAEAYTLTPVYVIAHLSLNGDGQALEGCVYNAPRIITGALTFVSTT